VAKTLYNTGNLQQAFGQIFEDWKNILIPKVQECEFNRTLEIRLLLKSDTAIQRYSDTGTGTWNLEPCIIYAN
jgi:hypothetical protein